jgi:Ca2+-binding RTX toxin-like protein
MATVTTNFPSLAAIDATGDKIFTAMSLESATTWAHTAFDNANDLAVSYYVGTPTSTYVAAVLTNGDSIQVYGSNLTGYPQTVTKLVYTANGQDLSVTLEGSVQFASELADPTGYVDKFIVTSGSSVVTANGYINVASDAPATFTSIDLVYGTASLHATGNLSVTDQAVVTGNVTGVTVNDGAMSFSVSGLNMAYTTAVSFDTMTAFLTSALAGNDTVNGTSAGEYLFGYGGADALNAGAGADTLNGGT